jgi:Lon protease-like protein
MSELESSSIDRSIEKSNPPAAASHEMNANSSTSTLSASSIPIEENDLDCALCYDMLYDPITLPGCGHSFCRQCVYQSLQIKANCAICRAPTSIDALSHPTTSILSHLVSKFFPQQSKARKAEITKQPAKPRYSLFLSNFCQFPGGNVNLHIFEPKYRIMINRALATNRQFIIISFNRGEIQPSYSAVANQQPTDTDPLNQGHPVDRLAQQRAEIHQAAPENNQYPGNVNQPADLPNQIPANLNILPHNPTNNGYLSQNQMISPNSVGCLVKIQHCRMMPDGRSLIECLGQQRVFLNNIQEEENSFGLLSAEVSPLIDEESIEDSTGEATVNSNTTQNSELRERKVNTDNSEGKPSNTFSSPDEILQRMRAITQLSRELRGDFDHYCQLHNEDPARYERIYGPIPIDPTELSYWILRAVPGAEEIKYLALYSQSLYERLELCKQLIQQSMKQHKSRTSVQSILIALIILCALISAINNRV